MAVAGTLEIQLLANIARLQKDMDDAKRSVGGAMSAIEKSVGLAARAFGVLGVSVSLGALVLAAKRINDTVDAMNDLADATGASIENISALDGVARRTGTSWDAVGQSLIKYNQALGTTTKAGSDAEKVLSALGLNAKTLRDLDPAEALRQTAVALSQFADDGNKARAVQELFGKSLKEVAPFLKDLAESGELVASVTTQQALEAEKFNKELFKMQTALTDTGRAIANPMVTGMNALIEKFRLGAKEGDGFIVTLLKQTEIARLLGMNKSSNGYSDTRRELDLLNKSLLSGGLSVSERDMAEQRQAELLARLGSYLNSTAGAGRGVSGYGDLPKGSLTLPSEVDKKAMAAAKKELEDQAKLLAELSGLSGSFAEDWARLNTIYAKGAITVDQLTEAQEKLLAQQPAMKKMADERKRDLAVGELRNKLTEENAKQEAKALAEMAKMMDEYAEANARGVAESVAAANQAEAELAAYGLLKSSVMELTLAHLEQSKELAALAGEDTLNIEKRIEAQKRLIAATRGIEVLDANKKAAEDAAREWQKASDQIGQSLTDALMKGGKSGADYIKDLFRTMVLRPIVQAAVQPVAGAVTNALGMGGGGFGNIAGLTNLAGGGMSMANSLGTTFANVTGTGLDGLLATNGAFGTAAGGTGLSGVLSAIPGWGWAALGATALLSMGSGGETRTGGQYNMRGLVTAPSGGDIGGWAGTKSTIDNINATLAALGSTKQLSEFFSGAESSKNGKGFSYAGGVLSDSSIFGQGQDGLGYNNNRGSKSTDQAMAELADELKQAYLQALQVADIPGQVGDYLKQLGNIDQLTGGALDAAIAAVNADVAKKQATEAQRTQLQSQLLELQSTDAENLARARQRELDAMDATLRPLLRQIQAQEDLKKRIEETNAALLSNVTEAYERVRAARSDEVSQLGSTVTRLRDYGRSLREFRDGLLLGNLSTLTPGQRLEEARRQLDAVASKARTGDQNAQGQVQGLVSAFLEASATYNASGAGFTSDFAYTQQLLTELSTSALAGADVAQLQLDALGVLNQSVLTIPAALTGLATAITTAIGAGLNPGAASIGALAGGVTGERIKTEAGSVYASASGASSLGNTVYTKNGKTFTLQELQNELIKAIMGGATSQDFATASAITGINRADALAALAGTGYESRLPAFRNGGMHSGGWAMVGEAGPELAYMPPSRIYSNSDTRQMLDIKPLVERIKSLEGTVEQLGRALVAATYDATSRAADKTVDGVAGASSRASFAAQTAPVLA